MRRLQRLWKAVKDGRRFAAALAGVAACIVAAGFIVLFPLGCSFNEPAEFSPRRGPTIRVKLMQNIATLALSASEPPSVMSSSQPTPRVLELQDGQTLLVTRTSGHWTAGGADLGTGDLVIHPAAIGSVSVAGGNGAANGAYRGQYRLVPEPLGKFDLVNDVDIDSYLAGVLPRELPSGWLPETYKAMAVVARTYALYEKATSGPGSDFDVYSDTRSQVYGGITAESSKSRQAVMATSGTVVVWGPPGHETIFKTYFSSCCGGVTQSAASAFGDADIPPLAAQDNHSACNASPNFNWGPLVIRKTELTRRFRLWGARRARAEKDMALVTSLAVWESNSLGRPVRFVITDARGTRYILNGEELRWAVNTDADNEPARAGPVTTLKSSFVKVLTDIDTVRFVEGHGWGHGVGLCQWCSQRRAEDGWSYQDIVLKAYPGARLGLAY